MKCWKIYRKVRMQRRKKVRKKWVRGLHVSKENRGGGAIEGVRSRGTIKYARAQETTQSHDGCSLVQQWTI
jgi:hypothetical protein